MANAFATNFTIPATNNAFQLLWKLTRVMKSAGWTTTASSDGYTKDTTGVAASDKWGGNANPLNDTYPPNNMADTNAAWIIMSGPKTVKISLNAAPTGTFIRGESVTQTTSSATGEFLGYVWDTVGLTGYAVIMPRTGTFNNSNVVTGAISVATFTPTGTVKVFAREVMFNKLGGTLAAFAGTNGHIYYVCADVAADAAQFFSAIAVTQATPVNTAISAGSNGASLPQATINVTANSTVSYPPVGSILVTTAAGGQIVTYTGTTASTFTGCSGGTGGMTTGGAVTPLPSLAPGTLGTTFAGTNGTVLPQATITVSNTSGFPSSGTFLANCGTLGGFQAVTYTGKTATTFTGCTGGTGTLVTGTASAINYNFPTKGICVRGTLTGTTVPWFSNNTTAFIASNNGQIACVNATPSAGVSADGSFYATAATLGNNTCGIMFSRVDDTEPGDIDPYVFMANMAETSAIWTNQSSSGTNTSFNTITIAGIIIYAAATSSFVGYAAKDCPVISSDLPSVWTGTIHGTTGGVYTIATAFPSPIRMLNHPAATPPSIRSQILLYNNGTILGAKAQIKGKLRWVNVTGLGQTYDTYDNKSWLVVCGSGSSALPAILFGPYDGTTTPTQ